MLRALKHLAAVVAVVCFAAVAGLSAVFAAEPEVRVIVPDVPGGAIVSGCYRAVGRIYGSYSFDFCLKQRATYSVTGGGVRCNGRLDWDATGATVNVRLKRTSCGNGVAWSADRMTCRPNLVLGIIGLITNSKKPFLSALNCDYTPAKGSGQPPSSFVVRRQD